LTKPQIEGSVETEDIRLSESPSIFCRYPIPLGFKVLLNNQNGYEIPKTLKITCIHPQIDTKIDEYITILTIIENCSVVFKLQELHRTTKNQRKKYEVCLKDSLEMDNENVEPKLPAGSTA
jgi:hypothetical protein